MAQYQTMTEMAADELRKAIMRGSVSPGTRLIPAKLEKELNLSRVAIREAIRELAGSGLVKTVMNVGAHVSSPPSLEELREIFSSRLILEPKLAVRASKNMTDRDLETLLDMCSQMENQSPPGKDFFFLNRVFHQTLYRISGWMFLCSIVSQFMDQILIYRSLHYHTGLDLEATNLEHRQMIESIRQGKSGEIKNLFRTHIQRGLDDIIKITR